MIDPRWERIEQLFFEAADRNGHERDEFLERACAGDAELRREVESLLATDATASIVTSTLIEGAIQQAAFHLFPAEGESMEGRRLGPWLILREIGRGGMGAVYLAERADDSFRKQVAIKLVKRGIDTDAVLHRFLHERQILAGLEHAHIAGLLDGGTSHDGRPYFVMEYVEGVPIQQFVAARKLSLRQRCELFRKVCEPVAYAHRNLVIHRDLKPANVLVTQDGAPKLLDFGIAKLLTTEAGDQTLGVDAMARPFTPAYASPEQQRGEAVNTATDVYSLGAVLFHLLTGKRPENSGQPARSSASVDSPAERKALAGDLDNIVLKATHPDAAQRYSSVDQLSDDVQRYLDGLPVLARQEGWLYQAEKFVRRHRAAVAAGTMFVLVVVAGIASVLWEARQAQIQRQRAEERLGELVEVANQTLLNVHGAIERLPGATEARRQIVRTTLDYLDKLNRETGNDQRILGAMASAYIRLARIEGDPLQPNLGDYKGAEATYRKAARILDDLIAANPDSVPFRMDRAECAEGLGQVLNSAGNTKEVNRETSRGLDVIGSVLQKEPKNLKAREHSAALRLLHISAYSMAESDQAKAEVNAALPVIEQLASEFPDDPDCILLVASAYSELGSIAGREGRTQDSLTAYLKGVALREKLFRIRPNDTTVERDLMMSYGHIGDIMGSPFFYSLGDSRGALENYRKAAKIAEDMVTSDAANRQAKVDLGIVLGRIGSVMQEPNQAKDSMEALTRSASILKGLVTATPGDVSSATQLATVYEYEARRLRTLSNTASALRALQDSSEICDRIVREHPTHQACMRQLVVNDSLRADIAAAGGDRDAAVAAADRMLAQAGKLAATGPSAAATYGPRSLAWAGDTYASLAANAKTTVTQQKSDWQAASSYYERALAGWRMMTPEMREQYAKEQQRERERIAVSRKQLEALR